MPTSWSISRPRSSPWLPRSTLRRPNSTCSGSIRSTTPRRLVDTRETGRSRILELDVPGDATAVSISLTAAFTDAFGFLTAYPCTEDVPVVATVNYQPDEVVSGTAFVPAGPDGTICVYVLTDTDVTVDLTGTFSPDGALVFQPASPTRMIDTRVGIGGWSPIHGQFQRDRRPGRPARSAGGQRHPDARRTAPTRLSAGVGVRHRARHRQRHGAALATSSPTP